VILAPYLDASDAASMAAAGYAELQAGVSAAAAWGTANRALYLPVYVLAPTEIVAMCWRNGATLGGTVDVGIYTRTFIRLASSGPVTQAGASLLQSVALALTLQPELYYFAMSSSSALATFWRWSYGATLGPLLAQSCGIRRQEAEHPLHDTPTTPVAPTTDFVPMLAATGRALL
jgi:hypothetical protein